MGVWTDMSDAGRVLSHPSEAETVVMSDDRAVYRVGYIEDGDDRLAAMEAFTVSPQRVLEIWGLRPLLREAGPFLPDLWGEGD